MKRHPSITILSYFSVLFAALVLAGSVQAESCLWKAESDHGTLYLQGSVHLLTAEDYPLAPAIEDAYADSEVLIFETDMKAMIAPETQQLILSKAILPGQQTLEDELDPEVYSMLAKKLAEAGLPAAAIQKFKPWFATMTLMLLRMQAMGLDPNLGLDQYFHRKAMADGKPEVGLESIEFQINLFDELSRGNQNGYTQHALRELEQMETMLDEMMTAWKSGDLGRLDKLTRASFEEYPEMYEKFVTARNRTWAEKLQDLSSKDKTCMVVVGTAHLSGKEGLLELLRQKGYTIKQL
jgi:uncharacterized protein YbaP (TraB family)